MQVTVNSANIQTFGFSVNFNIYTRQVLFDTSALTVYNGSGASNVLGIAFSFIDQEGVVLASIDWTAPQIPSPSTTTTWTLDLSSLNYNFLFQNYQIIGAIKDQDGTVYSTPNNSSAYKTVCQPLGFCESGYVPGLFQLIADCINNSLTVKDLTVTAYNNLLPISNSETGTLTYPTGTVSPISFQSTPFSNNYIVTGEYRIVCTNACTYDLQDAFYVVVTFVTNNPFDITCSDNMANILCCVYDVQQTKIRNCNNAIGERAAQQLEEITIPLMLGFIKEANGQDASEQASYIRKLLNCNCGISSISQNELNPVNPSVYSIVLVGQNGTSIPSATITGNTKTYTISSNVYAIVKSNSLDTAYTITLDTSTHGTTKYKIAFNYDTMAGYILTAIGADPTLQAQLNSLVEAATNIDLTGLNGRCVIDLSSVNYFLSLLVPGSTSIVKNIVVGSTTHNAPAGLYVGNTTGINSWLNGLGLGTYNSSFSTAPGGSYINILTNANSNNPVSMTFTINGSDVIVPFQKTNVSLIAFLQAMVDYLCGITALQVTLGNTLQLCDTDYNGNVVTTTYGPGTTQSVWNSSVSASICDIIARMQNLTGITCANMQSLFQQSPSSVFNIGTDSIFGVVNGGCIGLTGKQVANAVIASIQAYSDVKSAFCAISCSTPGTCPDVASISLSPTGTSIGLYGITWASTTNASQTVSVKYRVTGTQSWTISTNSLIILPNGNISGNTPYAISPTTAGTTYDVQVINNCGGLGFIGQITMPTGTVYTGSYLYDTVIYNVCGDTPHTLYSSAPFATGVVLYTNIGLTTPLTGYTYVAAVSTGLIYNINSSTGVIGTSTGSSCTSGTSGTYQLGNSTGTICSSGTVTLYTNGAFSVGGTLYNDSGLTSPVTGYSYVVNTSSNHIYNLNSTTGIIGADAGITCTGTATLTFSFTNAGGSFLRFNALLSRSVDANVVVTRMYADGFPTSPCTSANSSAQNNATNTILSGSTGFNVAPGVTSGTWNLATKSTMYNIIVNGVSCVNGTVLVIGSYNVTVVIPSCS